MTVGGAAQESGGLVRLNKYLAECGLGSRRSCDALISAGKVYVNGERVTRLGTKIDAAHDRVEFKKQTLTPVMLKEYHAFHKPRGPVVTRSDPQGRPTIYDLLRSTGRAADHLNYAGRLDMDSEGIMILTNDGSLIHALTHPRFAVKKVYRVRADRAVSEQDAVTMTTSGVVSEGQVLRAARVRDLGGREGGNHWYEVDLFEGRNRQIRRIFEGLGYTVSRLVRVQFGSVKLGALRPGELRPLTQRELAGLMNTAHRS